jgi:hypothetical protein
MRGRPVAAVAAAALIFGILKASQESPSGNVLFMLGCYGGLAFLIGAGVAYAIRQRRRGVSWSQIVMSDFVSRSNADPKPDSNLRSNADSDASFLRRALGDSFKYMGV